MLKRKLKKPKAVKPAVITNTAKDADAEEMHKTSVLEERLEELSRDYVILRDGIKELQRKRDLIEASINTKAESIAAELEKRSIEIYERSVTEILGRVYKYLVDKPIFEIKRFYCLAGDEEFAQLLNDGWVIVGSTYDHNKNKLCQIAQRVVMPASEEEFLRGYNEFYRKVKLNNAQIETKTKTKKPKGK